MYNPLKEKIFDLCCELRRVQEFNKTLITNNRILAGIVDALVVYIAIDFFYK
jgi:hypothetical protein